MSSDHKPSVPLASPRGILSGDVCVFCGAIIPAPIPANLILETCPKSNAFDRTTGNPMHVYRTLQPAAPPSLPLAQPPRYVTCICGVSFGDNDTKMLEFHNDCPHARFVNTDGCLRCGLVERPHYHYCRPLQHYHISAGELARCELCQTEIRHRLTETVSLPLAQPEGSSVDWAIRAAEKIYLLYRDSNYFKSMPKEPLIAGWAEIILDNAPTAPFVIPRLTDSVPLQTAPIRDGDPDSPVSALPQNLKEKAVRAPPLQPLTADEQLKQALQRVYEKYGNNLSAFFEDVKRDQETRNAETVPSDLLSAEQPRIIIDRMGETEWSADIHIGDLIFTGHERASREEAEKDYELARAALSREEEK